MYKESIVWGDCAPNAAQQTPGEASRLFFTRLSAALPGSPSHTSVRVPLLPVASAPYMTNDKAIKEYAEKRRQAAAEAARERIETQALVDLLQNYALDRGQEQTVKMKNGTTKKVKNTPKMNGTKLKAIELLLDKSVPNLSAVKHDVEVSNMTFVIKTDYEK